MASTCRNTLLVGAIDFGTTFSGWAYSSVPEFKSNPTKVNVKQWTSGTTVTEKTPTCALISPDGRKLIAFGYDAENKYRELAEKNEHRKYYYFRRFKMKLNKEAISRDLLIEDEMGKTFLAIDVFSYSIAALVDDMINTCSSRVSFEISKDDVLWVLTVPAIWSEAAKQFMREAATNKPACIKSDKLLIALEPEAASLFCRHLPVESFKDKYTITSLPIGTKYMVLDAGGGTIDITIHEVDSAGGLKEVYAATGGGWGGILVDEAFKHLLTHLMGEQVYETFVSTETEDCLELWQKFEVKKKTIDPDNSNKITMTICDSLRNLSEKMRGLELKAVIARSRYGSQIEVKGDKIRIDSIVMQELFQKAISTTVAHVKSILKHDNCRDVEAILMVGDFSESPMLQKAIKQEFSNLKIIIPKEASSSILRGAVIFGHDPVSISQRVLGKTYGTETTKRFQSGLHDEKYRIHSDTGDRCDKLFEKFVEKGQILKVGTVTQEHGFHPICCAEKGLDLLFYASDRTDPKYTDKNCRLIGKLTIDLTNVPGDLDRKVFVSIIFGETELRATCRVEKTGQLLTTKLDFLG